MTRKMYYGSDVIVVNVINEISITPVPTLYFLSSSNFSSNLWIFFRSAWILFESWADVNSSFSSSQEPREELRLRLEKYRSVVNFTDSSSLLAIKNIWKDVKCLPDKWVCVGWWGRHFRVVQVLLAVSVGVEARRQHRVAVLLQELPDQTSPGVRGQSSFLAVHALPLRRRVCWDWFWETQKQTFRF